MTLLRHDMEIEVRPLLAIAVSAAVSSVLTFVVTTAFPSEAHRAITTHELAFPLMLQGPASTGANYLLPQGTTLYFDKAYPEGFVRFRVYVNVDGIKLETKKLADPTTISPLTAYPIGKPELLELLRGHPLSKDELASILGSAQLSKDEIRATLVEFGR